MTRGQLDNLIEEGMTILALLNRAKEEGLEKEMYNELTEDGLTEEQKEIAENWCGEGRVRLNGDRPHTDDGDLTTYSFLDKLAAGQKLPWVFTLDGVEFCVKTSYGEGGSSHSRWSWREEGYEFCLYKAQRDSCVDSIEIRNIN